MRNTDDVWGADLVDMRSLSADNEEFKYMMVIDVFSKFGWAVPLKFKTGVAVRDGLEGIFSKFRCKRLWVDKGTEFYNKDVKKMLGKYKIPLYSTENFEKCSVVERWNLTIKSQLWRFLQLIQLTDILMCCSH